tara:strand:- start:152 stop:853 length:702 start_codon:yes stop_codon:yes gene_type:complete
MKIDGNKYVQFLEYFVINKWSSPSQLGQDLFVIYFLGGKKNGFFIEIGACDGIQLSNSLKLEKLGWNGIISEPSPYWINKIKDRKCIISTKAVFNESDKKLDFSSVENFPDLSGIQSSLDKDDNNKQRKDSKLYKVETITLNDLIEQKAPNDNINYISIDTEGSEYEIIKDFNFKKYNIDIFTIEHNFIANKRSSIFNLMTQNGYIRVFQNLSQWDDWYVKKDNKVFQEMIIK